MHQKYMNKIIKFNIVFVALAVMLVFGAMPSNASAQYNPYGTYINSQYGYGYNTEYYSPTVVVRPVYIEQPVYYTYPALTVSCSANISYYPSNYSIASVTWTANAYGGNGYYSYSWSGTDGLSGSNRTAYNSHASPGLKYAYVTVYSAGQSITQACSPVNIVFPYQPTVVYQPVVQPVYRPAIVQATPVYNPYQNRNSLDIGCFVDPTNAKVDQPVTWTAEVTGGIGPYTYSWTGSDNLNGSQSSVIKYYSTPGSKSAIVTVTSADGKTGVKACSNGLTIASAYKAPAKKTVAAPVAPVVTKNTDTTAVSNSVNSVNENKANTNTSVANLLTLNNVPWGWVSVIIILILFFTVMYLLFNRKKI